MDDVEPALERIIAGRLLGVAARTDPEGVKVWFAYQPVGGESITIETIADDDILDSHLRYSSC